MALLRSEMLYGTQLTSCAACTLSSIDSSYLSRELKLQWPVVLLQIILVCKTIIQRPKRGPMNYFTVLFICYANLDVLHLSL